MNHWLEAGEVDELKVIKGPWRERPGRREVGGEGGGGGSVSIGAELYRVGEIG